MDLQASVGLERLVQPNGPWADEVSVQMALSPAPTLNLTNHISEGQIGDQFTTTSPATAVLFRFNLGRAGSLTVGNIRVNYSTGSGVVDVDFTAGALYRDNNNDGAVDGGDTALQTGISGSGGQLAFVRSVSSARPGTNYLVQATVANLVRAIPRHSPDNR
jgi:hypothetical protein